LALPADARAALADSLWESLEQKADNGIDEAWRSEVKRRLAELDSETVSAIPWSEARAQLMAKLRK
jgi:putative addiction module component (TIGR02574 family)